MDGSGLASAGNLDVLQAGVAAEACTNNNPPTPPYYVWYEWFTQGANTRTPPCEAASVNVIATINWPFGQHMLLQRGQWHLLAYIGLVLAQSRTRAVVKPIR